VNEDGDRLVWIVIAAVIVALVGLWATGALAAVALGGGWDPLPAAELPATAVRLLSHLGDPAAAWPAGRRRAMPGAVAFWVCALLVAALMALLTISALRAAARLGIEWPGAGAPRRAPTSRWGRAGDLRPLRVRGPQPGRLTLGRHGRSLLAADERQSVIVVAPTQSHKTTGLAIPALLEWEGPVLATSVKTDLLLDTLAHRESKGRVLIFDPSRTTGLPRARVTPLWGAGTWRGAMRVAHWLAAAARTGSAAGLQDADFWFAAAEKLLSPLLLAAATEGLTMASVVRWLDEGAEASEPEVLDILRAADAEEAARAYLATQNREERQRSSVYTTAEMIVAAFADPEVAAETAGADYSPTALLDGGANTLYLCAPLHEQERLRPLFSMIVQELLAVVYEAAATTGRPLDPPLLLLLDEAANIAPIPNLDEIAATGAGQGIQLLSVFQDLAQIGARYGRRSATIVNNHRAKLIGSGISDPETLTWASRVIGAGEFEQRSQTAGERGRRSTTQSDTYRDLAPAGVLREGALSTAVLIYGCLPPAQIRLRPWFQEADLRRLREASSDGSEVREVGR
jgi:type IV secretion system protein VirD4